MKPLVIYHADCTDGFGAAFAAWLKLGYKAEYLPMQYGISNRKALDVCMQCSDREVYILDFSFPRDVMEAIFQNAKRVVWLDHHRTAFEMWCSAERDFFETDFDDDGSGYILLNNNKSGALLTWEYFHPGTEVPMLIKHIDDRDRWKFKLEGSKELHAALASYKPWGLDLFDHAREALRINGKDCYLFKEGAAILRAQDAHVKSMLKQARKCSIYVSNTVNADWCGNKISLALNTPMHMSEAGHELATTSGTFGLVWYIRADNKVKCSLRSNGDYDVSAIARAFGGGGHKNAAGFETDIQTLMGWLHEPKPSNASVTGTLKARPG